MQIAHVYVVQLKRLEHILNKQAYNQHTKGLN